MELRNALYGLFLCSVVSLASASDKDVFTLVKEQEDRINFGEISKVVVHANMDELGDDQHPLLDIAHPPKTDKEVAPVVASTEDSEKDAGKEVAPVVASNGFAFLAIKDISKQHMFGLTAGAMFVGYCIYKIWHMFTDEVEQVLEELKVTLTHQDREILFTVLQAMAQDIDNLRENKHEVSAVAHVDLSSLSEILAPECKVLCSNFVELYNAIDRSGNNIEIIIMFYGEFERAVQALLLQAEII